MGYAAALIGVLMFCFSIIYRINFQLKKKKQPEKLFSRKIFYSCLIGGVILFYIGGSFIDTSVQAQLDKELENNTKLKNENNELSTERAKLEEKVKNLESKISEYKESNKKLEDEKLAFTSKEESLNNNIDILKSKNKELQKKINNLDAQLASANNNSSVNTTITTTSSGEYEAFENCTDLRGTYPNGVPEGHPAYVPSMDRDKDGYACER